MTKSRGLVAAHREELRAKVLKVLSLMEGGMAEKPSCRAAGINRSQFRASALKMQAAEHYARATEAIARDQVDKIEGVIDDMRAGKVTPEQARVEIDARKWVASKLWRPLWGDKVETTVVGSGAGGAIVVTGVVRAGDLIGPPGKLIEHDAGSD